MSSYNKEKDKSFSELCYTKNKLYSNAINLHSRCTYALSIVLICQLSIYNLQLCLGMNGDTKFREMYTIYDVN